MTNGSASILTDRLQTNGSLTDATNGYSEIKDTFMKTCISINKDKQRPVCFVDFPRLTQGNFRYFIHKNRANLEVVHKGRPTFYKVKGIKLPLDSHLLTDRPTGVGQKFINILEDLSLQEPMIHDIKVKVETPTLHTALLSKGCSIDPTNNLIKINFDTDPNITTKILVYPKTTQIDLGCTYQPLVYNVNSLLYLHEHLSKVSSHLTQLSKEVLPQVSNWVITHYHFNKDGSIPVSGQSFNVEFEEMSAGLIRLYSKKFPDKRVARLEQIQSPKIPLKEMMQEVILK